jgi:hypothetical protein
MKKLMAGECISDLCPSPIRHCHLLFVMAGLVPAIHVFVAASKQDVDARDIGERKRRRPSDGYARA